MKNLNFIKKIVLVTALCSYSDEIWAGKTTGATIDNAEQVEKNETVSLAKKHKAGPIIQSTTGDTVHFCIKNGLGLAMILFIVYGLKCISASSGLKHDSLVL